ncbi:Arrestin C-terminal-like domain-containing protein [Entamoeba marina]
MSSNKTKAVAKLILQTDVLILPDALQGVIELEAVRICTLKSVKIELRGNVTTAPDAQYQFTYPPVQGKPYHPQVQSSMSQKVVSNFWKYSYDVPGETFAVGDSFYEYPPGKHYIPFSIPLQNFPHSINDVNHPQALYYTATAVITINYPELIKSNTLPYYIIFNKTPKEQLGQPKKLVVPPSNDVDMDLTLSATTVRIGDEISLLAHITNKSKKSLNVFLKLTAQFENSIPILLQDFKFPDVPSKGGMFGKKGQNEKVLESKFKLHPGLFPTSTHPQCNLKYTLNFYAKCGSTPYQLTTPIILSALPPQDPQLLGDCLNKFPVLNCDRSRTFTEVFKGSHFTEPPQIPFEGAVEQVSLRDSISEKFYVDHLNRSTMLTLDDLSTIAPFPYPNWRSVLLPPGYATYYYHNSLCFVNFNNRTISYYDPREPHSRKPPHALTNEPLEIVLKINKISGLPIVESKEPIVSIGFLDYSDLTDKKGQKPFIIKSQTPSFEPDFPIQETVLTGFVNNRMNILLKIFQEKTFSEVVYGYVNVDIQYLPMGVEITDWFPIFAPTSASIGMGQVNISVAVRNRVDKQVTPIVVDCVSKMTKMWYPMSKAVKDALKNEEKHGLSVRHERQMIEHFDYETYSPKVLPDKQFYLKQITN